MRCFISVDVPEELKGKILQVQEKLKRSGADLKLVKKENLHLTIKFLGDISEKQITEVKEFFNGLEKKSFEISIEGMGVFPNENHVKVVWLDIKKNQEILFNLMKKLDEGLKHIRDDKRGPVTHLTVARVGSQRNKDQLKAVIQELKEIEIGVMKVDSLKLMSSELMPEGPRYRVLAEFKMKQAKHL